MKLGRMGCISPPQMLTIGANASIVLEICLEISSTDLSKSNLNFHQIIDFSRLIGWRMSWWASRRSWRGSPRNWSRPSQRCPDTSFNLHRNVRILVSTFAKISGYWFQYSPKCPKFSFNWSRPWQNTVPHPICFLDVSRVEGLGNPSQRTKCLDITPYTLNIKSVPPSKSAEACCQKQILSLPPWK